MTEPALAAAGPGFAEIFATLPVAVLLVDSEGAVAGANAAFELLLNQSERAMLGHPVAAVFRGPEGYPGRRDGHGFAAFDAEIVTRHGQRLQVDLLETEVSDYPGWRTITLHHAAASRRLGVSADRAGAARAAVGAAAMLAHEVKNPLSGIRGAAQLLAGGKTVDREMTGLIVAEVDRIAALIDRMQGLSDTRPLNVEAANIYPLLDHARRVALAGFAREAEIEERFDPSLPPVLLDKDAFLQVMVNLLKNASEAGGTQIVIATAYRHGMSISAGPGKPRLPLPIEICIADNGPGPPPDIAEHLFDPFVSGKPEGTGLGLALVDKLVRDMGGIIQFAREGVPEQTIFRILLPRGGA